MKHYKSMIALAIVAILVIGGVLFLHQKKFGRQPHGARLERMKQSPNFHDGQFWNLHETPTMTSEKGFFASLVDFLFSPSANRRPTTHMHMVKSDLRHLNSHKNTLVWFGHSSYLMQVDGLTFLIDPVFCEASPVSFVNKPFAGTDAYKPDDMPEIDYLIITHDHWDHLDYQTVMQLKQRTQHVVCPLGVGEHFEHWGFAAEKLIELDWNDSVALPGGTTLHCLPARHFSGRGLRRNNTLWASYMLQTPSLTLFMGGDGGYDTHFAEIGQRFPHIDWAILENGQYNTAWRYIHTMPQQLASEINDLHPKQVLTVHHAKYALAYHPWNEPMQNEQELLRDSLPIVIAQMGEQISL